MKDRLRDWKDRLRSWWDVNVFTLRVLRPPSHVWLVGVSTLVFVGGIVLWLGDLFSQAWVGVFVGLLGLGMDISVLAQRCLSIPRVTLRPDDRVAHLLPRLRLTQDYVDEDFQLVQVPHRSNEYVVRSPTVDSFLRQHDVVLHEQQELLERINDRLRRDWKRFEDALRIKYRQSSGAVPLQRFINEAKTCLGQDLFQSQSALRIYKGSYFHSFLTNELATQMMESRGPRPRVLLRGSDQFPATLSSDSAPVLKRIGESLMANHIGISTAIHTADGQLNLWRQSGAAQQSHNLVVLPGSGSCDWVDWTGLSDRRSLKNLIARAMEREFKEESFAPKLQDMAVKTAVLGFFRWVTRGGKPEFVGISKTEASSRDLEPNVMEVEAPDHIQLTYPAATLGQLRSSINELLQTDRLSVPLWVCLSCLDEALRAEPSQWVRFLEIQK